MDSIKILRLRLEDLTWEIDVLEKCIRDYAKDKHKTADDSPFGGGSGMLMRADVLANCLDDNIIKAIS